MSPQREHDVIQPGTLFQGKYRIGSVLGRGDSAIVYEAGDQFLDEPVALKLIPRSGLGSPEQLARTRQEVKVMRRLHHPNLVEIREAGVNDDYVFIAMEKLEGATLRDILVALRRLSVSEALAIGIQVADAMATAHELDAIHRDLKPENLVVLPGNVVKVLHFGRYLGCGDDSTEDNGGHGTPWYMSPEQILRLSADALVDIYALGVILHEALAGQHYLIGSSLRMHRGADEGQIESSPPRLSEEFDHIPESVAGVIAKMMARRPRQRYESMREVAAALREAQHRYEIWSVDGCAEPPARDLALAAASELPPPHSPRSAYPFSFPRGSDRIDGNPDSDSLRTHSSMSATIPRPAGPAETVAWRSDELLGPDPSASSHPVDSAPPRHRTPLPTRSVRFLDGSATQPQTVASARPGARSEAVAPGQPSRLTVALVFLAALLAAIPVGAGIATLRNAARRSAAHPAPSASKAAHPAARAASKAEAMSVALVSATASSATASAETEPSRNPPGGATHHAAARLASPIRKRPQPAPTATGAQATPPSSLAGLPVIRPKGGTDLTPTTPPDATAAKSGIRLPASGLDPAATLPTSPLFLPQSRSAPQHKPTTGTDP